MSISDPLIKELKGWTRKLTETGETIVDGNADLTSFCRCLEKCWQRGVLMRLNSFGLPKLPEAWYWIEDLSDRNPRVSFAFNTTVDDVKRNGKVNTPVGRLRLAIRGLLSRKCLHVPLQLLVRTPGLALDYYDSNSILGNEILGEILLSVLLQIDKLNFNLNLRNASFLDETWLLPRCVALELVPCKSIGISVCFVRERALIIRVDPASVAAEDDKIKVGYVIDEINGTAITTNSRGKLKKIMKKANGQPISVHLVKLYVNEENEEIYEPIVKMIKESRCDYMLKLLKNSNDNNCSSNNNKNLPSDNKKAIISGYAVNYCGKVSSGSVGDIKQIEKSIWLLLKSNKEVKSIPVRFECLEIGVRITQSTDDNVIMNNNYMEISSCGRSVNIPDYFAFIAGNANCNVATAFEAHVFHHKNSEEVEAILQNLGQGFQRTHFAV